MYMKIIKWAVEVNLRLNGKPISTIIVLLSLLTGPRHHWPRDTHQPRSKGTVIRLYFLSPWDAEYKSTVKYITHKKIDIDLGIGSFFSPLGTSQILPREFRNVMVERQVKPL